MKKSTLTLKNTIVISLIIFANLSFLFFLKYSRNTLAASEFNLFTLGNFLNAAFALITILGLIILYLKKASLRAKVAYLLVGLLNIFLLAVAIIQFMNIQSREYYFFSLSFTQVLIIIGFGFFQLTQLILLLFIWLVVMKIEKVIYLRALVNSLFIGLGIFIFTLMFLNTKMLESSQNKTIDNSRSIAVVLGAAVWSDNKPSPSLAHRVEKAAELFNRGLVTKIQLTGGNAPGELSEAETAFNYILQLGLNRENVALEKNTTSTIEQINFIKRELIEKKKFKRVIIVSDIYHLKRVKEICKFYGVEAEVAASDLNLRTDKIIFYQVRECFALILFWLFGL